MGLQPQAARLAWHAQPPPRPPPVFAIPGWARRLRFVSGGMDTLATLGYSAWKGEGKGGARMPFSSHMRTHAHAVQHTRAHAAQLAHGAAQDSGCSPRYWHLCGGIERIPGGTRENDGLEAGLWGATAPT